MIHWDQHLQGTPELIAGTGKERRHSFELGPGRMSEDAISDIPLKEEGLQASQMSRSDLASVGF